MTHYDDDSVIALLKESVPAVPDLPGRTDAVRRLAGRQRNVVATQTLGCLALVVALVGGTVVVSDRLGTGSEVTFEDMAAAMAKESTVRYSITMTTRRLSKSDQLGDERTRTSQLDGAFDLRRPLGRATVVYSYTYDSPPYPAGYVNSLRAELLVVGEYQYVRGQGEDIWIRSKREPRKDAPTSAEEMVDKILEGVTSSRRLGTDRIRGVPAVGFDLKRETSALPGYKTAREVLWLDHEGRLLRWEQESTYEKNGTRAAATMRTDFYEYGVRVEVEAPPAEQVRDE